MNKKELDKHLQRVLEHLFDNWEDPKSSTVAAALVDGDNVVYATTTRTDEGLKKHAERNAIEIFKARYGKPSENAFIIVTLSPCFNHSPTREGGCCSSLLKDEGIRNLYIGAMDKIQGQRLADYTDLGISAQVSKDKNLAQCCYMLEDMAERHVKEREEGGKTWQVIKQETKNSPLCPKKFFQDRIAAAKALL